MGLAITFTWATLVLGFSGQEAVELGPTRRDRVRLSAPVPAVVFEPNDAMRYAALSLGTDRGRLTAWAADRSEEGRSARTQALLAWQRLCEPSFLPVAARLLDEPDPTLVLIGRKAVEWDPVGAWPFLLEGAERGSVGCVRALALYPRPWRGAVRRFVDDASPEVRVAVLETLWDKAAWVRALDDPADLVCESAVRAVLSERGSPERDRLFVHPDPRIRASAVRWSTGWTNEDRSRWKEFVRDPSPKVRFWGLYRVAPLGTSWGYSSEDAGAILEAVRTALNGSAREPRRAAVAVLRCWMTTWDEARETWRPEHLARATALFRSAAMRRALWAEARSADSRFVSPTYENGIALLDPLRAFAMTGDRRAFPLLASKLTEDSPTELYMAVARSGDPRAWPTLVRLVVASIRRASARGLDSSAARMALWGLAAVRPVGDLSALVALLDDRSVGKRAAFSLVDGLIEVSASEKVVGSYLRLVRDSSVAREVRLLAVRKIGRSAYPNAGQVLRGLERSPDREVAAEADRTLRALKER
ncbi:MAG: hypothetical protein KIS66_08735 [Fimbriimonadaceae bacterium]|nr:hypothetical protein [Fimbriimonadaceae bacterium]